MVSIYLMLLPPGWNATHVARILQAAISDIGMHTTRCTPRGFTVLAILDKGDTDTSLESDYLYCQLETAAVDRVEELAYAATHDPQFDADRYCFKLEKLGLVKL